MECEKNENKQKKIFKKTLKYKKIRKAPIFIIIESIDF